MPPHRSPGGQGASSVQKSGPPGLFAVGPSIAPHAASVKVRASLAPVAPSPPPASATPGLSPPPESPASLEGPSPTSCLPRALDEQALKPSSPTTTRSRNRSEERRVGKEC